MINKFVRILVTAVGGLFGYCLGSVIYMLAASTYTDGVSPEFSVLRIAVPVAFTSLCGILAFMLAPGIKRNWSMMGKRIEKDMERISVPELLSGVVGLIIGLVISYLLSGLFSEIETLHLGMALTILTYILLCCLCVFVATRIVRSRINSKNMGELKKSPILAAFAGKSKGGRENREAVPKILDTSVLIDGRITDIMKTGFVEGKIIIPEFVLTELRHLSDSADPMKKIRGRRGLEILKEIQAFYGIEIYNTYSDKDWDGAEEVDIKLLRLAQKMGGKVITNDFNLIQVAEIQEIPVLNINDVVKALRPVIIPGETLRVQVIREGRENNQGVGYLDDGTMIVVEGGRHLIGKDVSTEVSSVLQTASGRMIFVKPKKS
ncbi:MAG: hypothetical protein Q4C14_05730 [Bacillota bacterium]|nr:hypothetical protein [Bacillota bacterium]